MRRDDLQPGETVQRALEDQVLQRDRGLDRQADDVGQPAIAFGAFGELRRALRVDEQYRAQLLRLGPYRMKFGIRGLLAGHAAADCGAPEPCFLTAVSSCWTARSGYCKASEAKAAKRPGCEAHSCASFSFCSSTIFAARSRSARYQNGLIYSTSMSTAIASMALSR